MDFIANESTYNPQIEHKKNVIRHRKEAVEHMTKIAEELLRFPIEMKDELFNGKPHKYDDEVSYIGEPCQLFSSKSKDMLDKQELGTAHFVFVCIPDRDIRSAVIAAKLDWRCLQPNFLKENWYELEQLFRDKLGPVHELFDCTVITQEESG